MTSTSSFTSQPSLAGSMVARQAMANESLRAFCSPCRHQWHRMAPQRCCSNRHSRTVSAKAERNNGKPILLFDAMDTLIWDPFYTEMPIFFDMKFQDLLSQKDSKAWPQFEKGEISEEELFQSFFKDQRPVNGPALVNHMVNGYRWIDGMEFLLLDLARQGVEMHIFSNYPSWYKRIEAKLAVTRFLPWTFVSCEGPIKGLRKPDPECYKKVAETLDAAPEQLMLIDDRQDNVVGALEAGWGALLFKNEGSLRGQLMYRRILDGKTRVNPG